MIKLKPPLTLRESASLRRGKAAAALTVSVVVFVAFLLWFPFFFSIAWPGLVAARLGLTHAWVVSVVVLLGLLIGIAIWSRRRPWGQGMAAGFVGTAIYCALAFFCVARFPVPLPETTAYDATPELRTDYLKSYEAGYRDGLVGWDRTYCFHPEPETRGFYEGAFDGDLMWHRFLGREMSEERRLQKQVSAAQDGVVLDLAGRLARSDEAE